MNKTRGEESAKAPRARHSSVFHIAYQKGSEEQMQGLLKKHQPLEETTGQSKSSSESKHQITFFFLFESSIGRNHKPSEDEDTNVDSISNSPNSISH